MNGLFLSGLIYTVLKKQTSSFALLFLTSLDPVEHAGVRNRKPPAMRVEDRKLY